jgi:peptidoglycan/LPS O-acetylase OafA/YrhL
LTEFALGAVTVNFLTGSPARWLQTTAGSLASLAGLLIVCAAIPDTGFIVALLTAPLLVALCADNALAWFLGSPLLHYLGEISYSIYLGHFLFTAIVWRLLSAQWTGNQELSIAISLVLATLFVVAFASITYFCIEQPGRRLLSDRSRRASSVA